MRHSMLLLAVAALCLTGIALAADEASYVEDNPSERIGDVGVAQAVQPYDRVWSIDYRVRSMFNIHTSSEFGSLPGNGMYPLYAPMLRLDWSLDSVWTGLQVGLEQPNWNISFEWLTPMQQ